MGQVLHGSATTTTAVRRSIQDSQESLKTLSRRLGINQKPVAKWKKRTSVSDLPTGPREPSSTVLSIEEEAIIVAFRGILCFRLTASARRLSLRATVNDPAPDKIFAASLFAQTQHFSIAGDQRR